MAAARTSLPAPLVAWTSLAIALSCLALLPRSALSTEDHARATGQPCDACHLSPQGGGALSASGEAYQADPASWRPTTAPSDRPVKPSPAHRAVRLALLLVHVPFGVLWVGTILYVHLVLKPRYAVGGLPRSELRLAWASMPAIALSGAGLTWMQWTASPGLFSTRYGTILLAKAAVFLAMVLSATFVTLFIGPRLRHLAEGGAAAPASASASMDEQSLLSGDGAQGRPTLVAVGGIVYDLGKSRLWRDGVHAGRHRAGRDLTDALGQAPHGPEVLSRFPAVASMVSAPRHGPTPPVVRVFVANAYFNLAGCFAILALLALWRW